MNQESTNEYERRRAELDAARDEELASRVEHDRHRREWDAESRRRRAALRQHRFRTMVFFLALALVPIGAFILAFLMSRWFVGQLRLPF